MEQLTTEPKEMETGLEYGVVHPCHKLYMNTLPRRRLDECFVSSILSWREHCNSRVRENSLICFFHNRRNIPTKKRQHIVAPHIVSRTV